MARGTGHDVNRRSLRAFPREVADMVLHVMKDHEVRGKMLDGGHLILYGEVDTLKVSRCRRAPDSVSYVRRLTGCDH